MLESSSIVDLSHSEYPLPFSLSKEGILIVDEGKQGLYSDGVMEHALAVAISLV